MFIPWSLHTVGVLRGVIATAPIARVFCLATIFLVACGKTPESKPFVVPKAVGQRESTYGKAMDQAEDLKVKVADYNASLEQAMEQGTNAEPPPKKTPAAPPAPPQ